MIVPGVCPGVGQPAWHDPAPYWPDRCPECLAIVRVRRDGTMCSHSPSRYWVGRERRREAYRVALARNTAGRAT